MRTWTITMLFLSVVLFAPQGRAQEHQERSEPYTLDTITVEGKASRDVLEVKTTQPSTESTINREGMDQYGGAAQLSPFKAVDILPSVNLQQADSFGLSTNESMRVRGQTRVFSTVEGLSIGSSGLTPGVADRWLYDMENLSSISLYRGAVEADKSLGPYNTGGTVDRIFLRPSDRMGFDVAESYGSFNFNKVFTRFDSGLLPTGTKIFGSYSKTNADKWKGEGDFDADIFNGGLVQTVSDSVKIEMFGSYSAPEFHNYRGLSYAQAKDLSNYYRFDYNTSLTSNRSQDISYYDYNRGEFSSAAYLANIEVKLPYGVLSVKPYFSLEDGYTLSGQSDIPILQTSPSMKAPGVQRWLIDHEMYGILATYEVSLYNTDFKFGYWYFNQTPPGPPTAQKAYRPVGEGLVFGGWTMLGDVVENHEWNSPFINVGRKLGDFYLSGGLRYVNEKLPSLNFINAPKNADLSYEEALEQGTVDEAGSVHGGTIQELLPNFGINYTISKAMNAYFNYGRNFGRPGFDNWSTYAKYKSAFLKRGLTAQYLWDQTRPEISDNFDLGLRYKDDATYVAGTLFYGIYHDKGVSITDPALGVAYSQNVGEAESCGIELEGVRFLTKDLSVFLSGSYNSFKFTKDIESSTKSVTEAKGNQVPDVPEYEARLGLTYRFFGASVSPILRYTGSRYGDVTDEEKIPGFATVDLSARYTMEHVLWCKSMTFGLDFYNLLDKKYIGIINVSDDAVEGRASYYAGAPFTVVGRVELKF